MAVEDNIRYYKKQSYVFYPPDYIKGIAEEAFDDVEKKIKKMYKDAMLDTAQRSIEKYKDLEAGLSTSVDCGEPRVDFINPQNRSLV